MSHVFLEVPREGEASALDAGITALLQFKGVSVSEHHRDHVSGVAYAAAAKGSGRIWHSEDGAIWLVALGCWLPLPAEGGRDGAWLIDQYRRHGATGLSRRLQGLYALIIGDVRTGCVHVITDRCGSLHLFHHRDAAGDRVSSSSAVLGLLTGAKLDPVALHEFVATGVVFEERSLFAGVRKVPPATVLTLAPGKPVEESRYWLPSQIDAESLSLDDAADALHSGLVGVLGALPDDGRPLVSDLTGGYDSRLLLSGLLSSNVRFETTVSGAHDEPDVVVARRIAEELGLAHRAIERDPAPDAKLFDLALRMTDGEYDAFGYSTTLRVHLNNSEHYSMSLNGSFGELARGYWWELLWPRLAKNQPLDAGLIARRRFAALPYDHRIFDGSAAIPLVEHMSRVAVRTVEPARGLPNTTQLDWLYYSMRMHRWQGRIASSTNQLWPSFSPIGFAGVLDPILCAKASARFRSLLARKVFSRHSPRLATIPLEHGYPPTPLTLGNMRRFTPLLSHYGGKVMDKIGRRLGNRLASTQGPPHADQALTPRQLYTRLFDETALSRWVEAPALAASGYFVPERLGKALHPDQPRQGAALEQWRRLVTVEALLRAIGR